jgi:hypothetical protein
MYQKKRRAMIDKGKVLTLACLMEHISSYLAFGTSADEVGAMHIIHCTSRYPYT